MRTPPSRYVAAPVCFLLFLLFSVSTGSRRAIGQDGFGFRVIVNESNPIGSLSKSEVSAFFLKRQKTWAYGKMVNPVDLRPDSAVRESFSTEIHGRQVKSIRAYWQRLIFQGREIPPPTRSTEGEVVDFIRTNPNAIGYVSREIASGAAVKVVPVTE